MAASAKMMAMSTSTMHQKSMRGVALFKPSTSILSSSRRQRTTTLLLAPPPRATLTTFAITPPGGDDDDDDSIDDVVECPTIRAQLHPRPSPFVMTNYYGGGFASDDDRVALSSIKFASPSSANASCQGFYADPSSIDKKSKKGLSSSSSSSSSSPSSSSSSPSSSTRGEIGGDGLFESGHDAVCIPLPPWAIRAGARETVYFDGRKVTAAIVTCGGLCPGLNDVVQSLTQKLAEGYGVGNIVGVRYGLKGFYDRTRKSVRLTPAAVEGIQLQGGTILGTSRGGADIGKIVQAISRQAIDMVFVVGGNGGNAAAAAIHDECVAKNVTCAVIGIPKSIDNDILLIDRCFGYDSAVEEAQRALLAAKVEASSAYRGLAIVKLMGRQSGFIATQASLSSGVVDVCLIPEVPFSLEGKGGLIAHVTKIIEKKGHAVVCVAEGAGQDLIGGTGPVERDASGNPILADVGSWLKAELKKGIPGVDCKLLDPSYMVRSIPANSADRVFCKILAHNAVHAAFAGYSGVTVGLVNTHYVYLPTPLLIMAPRRVDPRSKMWNRLRSSLKQPSLLGDGDGEDEWEDGQY